MRIVNLTPHAIHIVGGGTLHSEGVARVDSQSVSVGSADGVPLVRVTFGEVIGLPAPEAGLLFVVSGMVRAALPGRVDIASPGELVRDETGRVVGCAALIIN